MPTEAELNRLANAEASLDREAGQLAEKYSITVNVARDLKANAEAYRVQVEVLQSQIDNGGPISTEAINAAHERLISKIDQLDSLITLPADLAPPAPTPEPPVDPAPAPVE